MNTGKQTFDPDKPIPYAITPAGMASVLAFRSTQAASGRHHARGPLPPWTPELYIVPSHQGVFTLTCRDGRVREFINLALRSAEGTLVVFYDPSVQDECHTFYFDQSAPPYLGAAMLLTETGRQVHQVMLKPHDLREEEWADWTGAPDCLTCYFRDSAGRLALGYRDGRQLTILSGPLDLAPVSWHRSHTKELLAETAAKALATAAATLTKGGQA